MTLAQTCTYAHTHTKKKKDTCFCTCARCSDRSSWNQTIPKGLSKTYPSPPYWAVCRRPTGPETTPKPLHPQHTGLYVADLQGLKPPQSTTKVAMFQQKKCEHAALSEETTPFRTAKTSGYTLFLETPSRPIRLYYTLLNPIMTPILCRCMCVYIYMYKYIYIYVLYGHLRGCGSHNV